jgi:hypothetical protein
LYPRGFVFDIFLFFYPFKIIYLAPPPPPLLVAL